MHYEIDLKSFDISKSAEVISDKVKNSLKENATVIVAIDDSKDISIIPKGKAEDILTLMVIEFIQVTKFYKIADIDGLLDVFVEQVKSVFNGNGD